MPNSKNFLTISFVMRDDFSTFSPIIGKDQTPILSLEVVPLLPTALEEAAPAQPNPSGQHSLPPVKSFHSSL